MFGSERDLVAKLIGTAMVNDPGWAQIAPDHAVRQRLMTTIVGQSVDGALRQDGEVYVCTVDGHMAGAIVCTYGAPLRVTKVEYVRGIVDAAKLAVEHPAVTLRCLKMVAGLERTHGTPEQLYIGFLGANIPGRGIGGKLLEHAHRQHPDLPIWLETQNVDNVGFYRKYGFEVAAYYPHVYRGGPYSYTMSRPALMPVMTASSTKNFHQ